jgi:hypothetical protein
MGISLDGLHAAVPWHLADPVQVDAQANQDDGAKVAQITLIVK